MSRITTGLKEADVKTMAKFMKDALKAEGIQIAHSRALEVTSKSLGYVSWHALCLHLKSAAEPAPIILPGAAHLSRPVTASGMNADHVKLWTGGTIPEIAFENDRDLTSQFCRDKIYSTMDFDQAPRRAMLKAYTPMTLTYSNGFDIVMMFNLQRNFLSTYRFNALFRLLPDIIAHCQAHPAEWAAELDLLENRMSRPIQFANKTPFFFKGNPKIQSELDVIANEPSGTELWHDGLETTLVGHKRIYMIASLRLMLVNLKPMEVQHNHD